MIPTSPSNSTSATASSPHPLSWHIEDIDLNRIDVARVRDNHRLFCLLASASFIESGADLYTRNLLTFFKSDPEISAWLRQCWEPEELQHGRALRAYIEHVWPEFDWQKAFDSFFTEYATYCKPEELEPTQAQELAARCVVETGTSSLYRAIHDGNDEPVLQEIAEHIRRDEVGHYKYFYRYFVQYRAEQGVGRRRVLATLVRRLLELRNSDAECALRHVLANSSVPGDGVDGKIVNEEVSAMVRSHLPVEMTAKMLLKPLQLSPRFQQFLLLPLQTVMRRFLNVPAQKTG